MAIGRREKHPKIGRRKEKRQKKKTKKEGEKLVKKIGRWDI